MSRPFAIAGLDIATVTGLALLSDGVVTTETFKAKAAPTRKKNEFTLTAEDVFADQAAKTLDPQREGEIGQQFEDFLRVWLIKNNVACVAIEEPLPSNISKRPGAPTMGASGQMIVQQKGGASQSAIFRMYGLEYIASTMCVRLNIPVIFIHQGTWRKQFLGNGRPKEPKRAARDMCEKLGIKIRSDDAAEAVGVLFALDHKINPPGRRMAEDLFSKLTSGAK